MKSFKIRVITIILLGIPFFNNDARSQWFYDDIEIIPSMPSSNDSITVLSTIEFPIGFEETCPPLSSFNTSMLDTTISLDLFYDISGAWPQVGCTTSFACNIGVLNSGNYLLRVNTNTIFDIDTTFNTFSEDIDIKVSNSSSIFENKLKHLITTFPIPTNDLLFIDFPKHIEIISLTLFNLRGKQIIEFDPELKKLNVANIDSGLYFLSILTNKGSVTKKVLVK